MDIRQLEYILAIAEERSLSRAADRLFLSQSALSQQLAKLGEQGLPPLFFRQKGEMLLTDAGRIYVNGARIVMKLLQDAEDALRDLGTDRTRSLNVSVSRRLQPRFYTRILPWLKHAYPDIRVAISTSEAGLMRRALESGELDLALFSAMRDYSEVLDYTVLNREELVLAGIPRRENEPLPVILPRQGTHLRMVCDHAFRETGFACTVYAELDDTAACLQLIRQGECAAVLPRSEVDGMEFHAQSFSPPVTFYTVAACRRGHVPSYLAGLLEQLTVLFQAPQHKTEG